MLSSQHASSRQGPQQPIHCRGFLFCGRYLVLFSFLCGMLVLAQDSQKPAKLTFEDMTPDELRQSLQVVATRVYAYYGFNLPEIQLHLPLNLNSSFASLTMEEPQLLDAAGNEVAFQLERGLHETQTQIMEIRFLSEDGQSPAQFSRAKGKIQGTYPLTLRTKRMAAGDQDRQIRIRGNVVEILEGVVPELPPFSELNPLRAFDSAGNFLETKGMPQSRTEAQQTWQTYQFDAEIARLEVDMVVERAKILIRYDVPIAKPLSERLRATTPKDERKVGVNPKSTIDIEVERLKPNQKPQPVSPKTKAPAKPKGKTRGEQVAVVPKADLSAEAATIAAALEALAEHIPQPQRIVQLLVFSPEHLTVTIDSGQKVETWTWSEGTVSGPEAADTQWLQCKKGLPAKALTWRRIPAIYDDAQRRVPSKGLPLQVIVGQSPCGKAFVTIPFNGGTSATYQGDGIFSKIF